MDAPTLATRWARVPSLDKLRTRTKEGKPRARRLTKRDIEIFKLLYEFRYLPSNDIHAFVGGSYEGVRRSLNTLYREGYVNRPSQQRQNASANYTFLIYELDTAGMTALQQRGFKPKPKKYHDNFFHELMVNRIIASIRLGIRAEPDARFIAWAEILANSPETTRSAKKPHVLPYLHRTKGGTIDSFIAADYMPFGIKSGGRYIFFPGIEADCGTEPIAPKDHDRSSIYAKFVAYLEILRNRTANDQWNVPVQYIPFWFPKIARLESSKSLLKTMTEGEPHLRRFFLFGTFNTLTEEGPQEPATGHVYTAPMSRAGMPDYALSQVK